MKKIGIVIVVIIGFFIVGQFFKKKMAQKVSVPATKSAFNASPSDAKVQLDTDQRLGNGPVVEKETTCSKEVGHAYCNLFKFGPSSKTEGMVLNTNKITIYSDITPYLTRIDEMNPATTDKEEKWILAFGALLLEKVDTSVLPYTRGEDFYAALQFPKDDKVKDAMVVQVPIGGLPPLHAFFEQHLAAYIKGNYPNFFDEVKPLIVTTFTMDNFKPTNRLKKSAKSEKK